MAQSPDKIGREVLPIPDTPSRGKIGASTPATPSSRPSSRYARPRVRRMWSSCCSTIWASAHRASPAAPARCPRCNRSRTTALLYNRFHTTALCSPTRVALLTGRNHHSAGIGSVAEVATGAPGNDSVRPNTVATVAEMLRLNGYSTGCVGKAHQTPTWEVCMSGPFDRWPTGEGFEKFYGFVGGETNQWSPTLINGTTPIEPPEDGRGGLPLLRGHHRQGDRAGCAAST